MTDAEWHALAAHLPTRGRPPRDRRATWDAVFWVACSTLPWAALPPELGRPDTTHSALLYAARTGLLDTLLIAASRHPFADPAMESLEWRVCCAVRRASRQLRPETLMLARDLGLASALYCPPESVPRLAPREAAAAPPRPVRLRLPRIPRRVLRGAAMLPAVTAVEAEPPPAGPKGRRAGVTGRAAVARRHAPRGRTLNRMLKS
jgi:transposase